MEGEGPYQLAHVLTQRCVFSWKWLFHIRASDPAAAKIDSQLLYTRTGWTGDCQEITEEALCFLEISLGLCNRTYCWPLLFTETSLTDSSASDHGFSSTSPVLDIIWNNFALKITRQEKITEIKSSSKTWIYIVSLSRDSNIVIWQQATTVIVPYLHCTHAASEWHISVHRITT